MTRYYFQRSTAAPVVVTASASWTNQGGAGSPRALAVAKTNGAVAFADDIAFLTTEVVLARQFVGPQIGAGSISGTVKGQMLFQEGSSLGNVRSAIGIRVVSADGSTVRGTLLAVGQNSTDTEFVNDAASPTNRKIANGTSLSSVTAQNGDRVVVEIGFVATVGAACEGLTYYGDPTAGDLPENETSTLDTVAPWVEFSQDIAAYSAGATPSFPSFYAPTNGATVSTFPQVYKPSTS